MHEEAIKELLSKKLFLADKWKAGNKIEEIVCILYLMTATE